MARFQMHAQIEGRKPAMTHAIAPVRSGCHIMTSMYALLLCVAMIGDTYIQSDTSQL